MKQLKNVTITNENAVIRTGAGSNFKELAGVYITENNKYTPSEYKNGYYFLNELGGWISENDISVIEG